MSEHRRGVRGVSYSNLEKRVYELPSKKSQDLVLSKTPPPGALPPPPVVADRAHLFSYNNGSSLMSEKSFRHAAVLHDLMYSFM